MRIVVPLICALAFATGLTPAPVAAQEGALRLPTSPSSTVTLSKGEMPSGLSPDAAVRVYVGAALGCCSGKSPIAGRYTADGHSVTFSPTFDFLEGQPYTVATWTGELTEFVLEPAMAQAPPEVLAIYPGGETVPENTLRFYIEFSIPMMPHQAEAYIVLTDDTGAEDPEAFMSFKQELWNADRTRLTLLMDPGRIKRGVAQNLRLGPALLEGRQYAITVKEGWPAATGALAADRFSRSFTVSAPLRSLPSTEDWQIMLPEARSRDPLIVAFDRPFDRVQTPRSVGLYGTDGALIPGAGSLEANGTLWRFDPEEPWTATDYALRIDARLEDVAGNNFRDTLDHALGTGPRDVDEIVVPLTIRNP